MPETLRSELSPAIRIRPPSEPYNAVIEEVIQAHSSLRILRIRPDFGPLPHAPGQFTILGLWDCARHVNPEGVVEASLHFRTGTSRVIKRAYSFSSRILDSKAALVDPSLELPLEFYVALVAQNPDHPPGLTPRLFALNSGDRIMVGTGAKGSYTLTDIQPDDDVVFAATGTGEAPHNAMIAELLGRGHRGRIVALACGRYLRDLAYLATHCELERQFSNYQYVPLTTREPSNIDPRVDGYVGKRYVQDYLTSEQMTFRLGRELTPEKLHVFVCGNPAMIGAPRKNPDGSMAWPTSRGVLQTLVERGFRIADHGQSGNVHYERYW